ncbi:MAG: hypothetical protein WCC48_10470 [Anaeromyxobacteraceae bacterium]
MRVLVLCLSVAIQVGAEILFYWMRVRKLSPFAKWDAIVFGVPLMVGATSFFAVIRSGRGPSGPLVGSIVPAALLAMAMGLVVEVIAMAIAFDVWGT